MQKIAIPRQATRTLGVGRAARPARLHPVLVAAVAVLYVALAAANGGYSSELTAGATVGIWWAVVIGLAMGAWPRSRVPASAVGAGASLAALAAWTAISIGWASDAGGAFVEVVRALGYLGLFILVVIASPRASARMWLSGLALGLVVVAGLGLASRFEPSFVGNQNLGTFLPSAAGRFSYPIGYWNGLAAAMAAGILLLVWLGGHARAAWLRAVAVGGDPVADPGHLLRLLARRRPGRRGRAGGPPGDRPGPRSNVRRRPDGRGWRRAARLAREPQARARRRPDQLSRREPRATRCSPSRSRWWLPSGCSGFLSDDWLEDLDVPPRLTRAVAIGTVIAVVAGILAANPAARWSEFKQVGALDVQTTYNAAHLSSGGGSGRYQFWSAALDAWKGDPVDGIGAGGYEAYWDQHGTLVMPVRNAHSLFFETMAELGVVGLVGVLGLLGFAAAAGIRRGPTRSPGAVLGAALAIFTAGVVSAAIDWTWELPACFGLVVLAAGLLAGPALEPETAFGAELHAVERLEGARSRAAAAVRAGRGDAPRRVGRDLGRRRCCSSPRSDWATVARRRPTETSRPPRRTPASAIKIEPWAAAPRLQLALVEELAGNLPAANREVSEAIDRAPDNWQLWFVRTRLDVKSGDVDGARRALERARELNPRAPFLSQ